MISNACGAFCFVSLWYPFLQLAGIIMGIISLCMGVKRTGIKGLVFSIVSILLPLIFHCTVFLLAGEGGLLI